MHGDDFPAITLRKIDRLCDEFESAWKAGLKPSIEIYLERLDANARVSLLRELLQAEWELLRARGEEIAPQRYAQRFSELSSEVLATYQRWRSDTAGKGTGQETTAECSGVEIEEDELKQLSIPGYEIKEVLGRGGMGIVYLARYLDLNRDVALKTVLTGSKARKEERIRFRAEAQAAASLRHPNVVRVYDVSEHNGTLFMALEYVAGGSLAERLESGSLAIRQAAVIVEQIANGVNAAHQAGFVHRDLKPSNILMEEDGTPRVADFGLVKQISETQSDLTVAGVPLGTPSYMSPEQAVGEARRVGPAADIYALGAILYACLTGLPPHREATQAATIQAVVEKDPVPPRHLRPEIPKDLETVCLKALNKDPAGRYPSAAALAEDLAAWLQFRPISARPITAAERTVKFCRRRPAFASLIGVSTAAAISMLVGTAYYNAMLQDQRDNAFGLQVQAEKREQEALDANAKLKAALEREQTLTEQLRQNQYVDRIQLAYQFWTAGSQAKANETLDTCDAKFRDWEWRYLKDLFAPDGIRLPGYQHVGLRGQQSIDLDLSGRLIAYTSGTSIRLTRMVADEINTTELSPIDPAGNKNAHRLGDFESVAISSDGKWVVGLCNSGFTVHGCVWDANTAECLASWKEPRMGTSLGVQFLGDGTRLACASTMGLVIRDWRSNEEIAFIDLEKDPARAGDLVSARGGLESLRVAEAQKTIAGISGQKVRFWDFDGKPIQELECDHRIGSIDLSPDGSLLAIFDASGVQLWDWRKKNLETRIPKSEILSACFGATSNHLLVGLRNRLIESIWIANGEVTNAQIFRGHEDAVNGIAFGNDANVVVSTDRGGELILRYLSGKSDDRARPTWFRSGDSPFDFALRSEPAADPRLVSELVKLQSDLTFHQVGPAETLRTFRYPAVSGPIAISGDGKKTAFAVNPDMAQIRAMMGPEEAVGGQSLYSRIEIRDTVTGSVVRQITLPHPMLYNVSLSSDGSNVAASYLSGREAFSSGMGVWDVKTGKRNWQASRKAMHYPTFHPTQDRLYGFSNQDIKVLDLGTDTVTVIATFDRNGRTFAPGRGSYIFFSPGGDRFVASVRNSAWLFDSRTNIRLRTFDHLDGLVDVFFGDEAKRLVCLNEDSQLRFWEVDSGKQVLALQADDIDWGTFADTRQYPKRVTIAADSAPEATKSKVIIVEATAQLQPAIVPREAATAARSPEAAIEKATEALKEERFADFFENYFVPEELAEIKGQSNLELFIEGFALDNAPEFLETLISLRGKIPEYSLEKNVASFSTGLSGNRGKLTLKKFDDRWFLSGRP